MPNCRACLGSTTTTVYDAVGNTTDVINANGIDTHFTFDAANRQVAKTTQPYVAVAHHDTVLKRQRHSRL